MVRVVDPRKKIRTLVSMTERISHFLPWSVSQLNALGDGVRVTKHSEIVGRLTWKWIERSVLLLILHLSPSLPSCYFPVLPYPALVLLPCLAVPCHRDTSLPSCYFPVVPFSRAIFTCPAVPCPRVLLPCRGLPCHVPNAPTEAAS